MGGKGENSKMTPMVSVLDNWVIWEFGNYPPRSQE